MAQMIYLFQSNKANVSEHIKHIFEEGELEKNSVVREFRTTASDGKNYNIEHYNLDMIISLGYRINRMVSAFFDLAEIKAQEHKKMYMKDWVAQLDKFVEMYGKGVLEGAGIVSHEKAIDKAEKEYNKYQVKTLSPVEKDYLETILTLQKKIEKKTKGKN